jgi:hypothetical protein
MSPTPQWVKDLKPAPPQGTDLIKVEREKSKISVERLSNFLFTKEVLERQQRILDILQADKVFDKSHNYFDGRVDRFKTALARAKRLRQLQVKHNWDRDEYMTANELISEPGPYGLHASMYLVWISSPCFGTPTNLPRPPFATKALQSNTNSSWNPPKTTEQLDAMRRLSLDMVPMCEVWKPQRPGIQRIRPLYYTLHTSRPRNGGSDLSDEQQTMLW